MEDRFSDILIDNAPENNRNKKIILLVIATVVLSGILAVFMLTDSNKQKEQDTQQPTQDAHLQEQEEPSFTPVDTQANNADRFDEIVRQIQERQEKSIAQTQDSTPATQEPTQPILEQAQSVDSQVKEPAPLPTQTAPTTPTQPQEPTQVAQTQPPKQAQNTQPQAPKPAQSAPKPNTQAQSQPKPKPTQQAQNTQPQAPKSTTDKSKNGQVAQRGHYIQVGNFENTPNKDFLGKIGGYSYRVQPEGGSTKYLIGPFSSRTDANRELLKIRTDVGGEAFYYEVK